MPDKPHSECPDHEHVIYRFYGEEGRLLYIGKTVNSGKRLSDHTRNASWWHEISDIRMERGFSNCDELSDAEIKAIKMESPRHNVSHTVKRTGKPSRPPNQKTTRSRPRKAHPWRGLGEAIADSNGAWLRSMLEA